MAEPPRVIVSVPPTCGIPSFEGKDSEDVDVFILKMKDYLVMHTKDVEKPADKEEVKNRIRYALAGRARTWLDNYLEEHPDFIWNDFIKAFSSAFSVYGDSRQIRLAKWRHLNWDDKTQNIKEYAEYVKKLGKSLNYNNEDILEYFKYTMSDLIYAQINSLSTIDECVPIIQRWLDWRKITSNESQLIQMSDEEAGYTTNRVSGPNPEVSNSYLLDSINKLSDRVESQLHAKKVHFKDPESTVVRYKPRAERYRDRSPSSYQRGYNQSSEQYDDDKRPTRQHRSYQKDRSFRNSVVCHYCNKAGHIQKDCRIAKWDLMCEQFDQMMRRHQEFERDRSHRRDSAVFMKESHPSIDPTDSSDDESLCFDSLNKQ